MNDEWYLRSDKARCGESGAGRAARGVRAHHLDLRRWSGVVFVTSMSASLASPSLFDTDAYGCTEVGGGCGAAILLAEERVHEQLAWARSATQTPVRSSAQMRTARGGNTER